MSRLLARLRLDARLQARNHVYAIVIVVTVFVGWLVSWLWSAEQLRYWMPILTLGGTTATTMLLVGMMIQLERGEGMLEAGFLTPLRSSEYIGSKATSLAVLALVEAGLFVALAFRSGFEVVWLLAAVVLKSLLGIGVGVAIGVRFDSIFRWLPWVIVAGFAFDLPNICYLANLWGIPLFWICPTMPSLLLAKAAFLETSTWEIAYSLGYGLVAAAVALLWAHRSMNRFVTSAELR